MPAHRSAQNEKHIHKIHIYKPDQYIGYEKNDKFKRLIQTMCHYRVAEHRLGVIGNHTKERLPTLASLALVAVLVVAAAAAVKDGGSR